MRPGRTRAAALALAIILALLPAGLPVPAARGAATTYAWAWGRNESGQLGDGSNSNSSTPVAVSGLGGVTAIAAGGYHSFALLPDGTVRAWGDNQLGQLGDGTTSDRLTPVAVSGLTGVTAIAGGRYHSLALLSDGTVRAWGYNHSGQLGDGTTSDRLTPVAVSGLSGVTAIAAGGAHGLALLSDGTVRAWGNNQLGQLGDGTTSDRLTPVAVSGLSGVTAIAAGGAHSLALLSDGTVRAWGNNGSGQLGDGSLTGVTTIDAGAAHSLALLSDGTVRAWGYNGYGQLGDGTTTSRSTPVAVSGLTGVTAIAGSYHSLALLPDGTVRASGWNDFGQLGDGTTTSRSTPVAVSGLTGVTAIAAGDQHSLALAADTTAPTGSIAIAGGAAYTNAADVSLDLAASDNSGTVSQMRLSEDPALAGSSWLPYAATTTFTLSGSDGSKTVYARFRDANANVSDIVSDAIVLDRVAPTSSVSALAADQSSAQFTVAWSGSDATSGIASYDVQVRDDGATPPGGSGTPGTWTTWRDATTATQAQYQAIQGHRYCFRSRARDAAGNIEAWPSQPDTCTRVADSVAPSGSITIAGGAAYTNAADVSLDLVASDNSGTVSQMRLSEDPALAGSSWLPYAATTTFTLGGADGTKTVYARFRDADGNVSDIVSDAIVLDRVAPAGALTINAGALTTTDRAVNVAVAATDHASGIGAYRLSNDGATWSDWTSASSWTLPAGDGTKTVYAQVRDRAGNVSLPASDAIDLDTTVASDDYLVSINGGAVYTNSPAVVLTLAAKPGTTQMKLSNDGGFSGAVWEPYASRRAWTTNSYGTTVATVSVYAKFRDAGGAVVATPATDDIILDPNAPTPASGTAAPATVSAAASAPYASTTVTLDTRATDDRSGVRAMMVSNASSFTGAAWEPYAPSRPWPISTAATTTVYLRFRDGAGNVSAASHRVLAAPATPTVPTQLSPVHGLGTTTRQPTFRWLGVSGATSYQLQVSADPSFGSVALSATTSVPSFTRSTPFARSTTLYWRVRVSGAAWSPAWRFTTPQADPPGLISPAAGSTSALLPPTLDWGAVAGADLYQVQLAVDRYFTAAVRSQTPSATAATFVPLAREARFFWRVRARVAGAWGAWSDGRSFSTPFLSRPTLRRPATGATVTRPLTLDWFDVNGAASYRVHVCADAACAEIVRSFTATGSILRFAATALPDGDYWWRVRAVAASGRTSAWSVLRSFTL